LSSFSQLCPELVVLPYDFPQYESVSEIVAEKLHFFAQQFNGFVEQVSCDESYIEINVCPKDHTGQPLDDFLKSLAERIRVAIFEATDCTASIGVGCNKLLAKLAADKVKPNASCVVKDWQDFLDGLALRDLHGIGRKIERKLTAHSLCTVNDIWELGGDAERVVGEITGPAIAQKIVQFCNGNDDRPVKPQVRKTIGAECNYGVRFDGLYGPDHMIKGLSDEVEKRMATVAVRGSKLTLKIMKSKDPSKMPEKFLGHGRCENVSKSTDVPLTRNGGESVVGFSLVNIRSVLFSCI
jgi:DNA repair protein REV1